MIRVDLEPKKLIANRANELTIKLSNNGNGPCTNLIFKIKLPVEILLLHGRDRIEHGRLDAGKSITHVLRVRPKKIGTWTLSAVNFSYRDALGQAKRINSLRFDLMVVPQDPQSVKTECEIVIDNNEFPFDEWEMLKGRIVNVGTATYRQITLRVDGSVVTDPSDSPEMFGPLLPNQEREFGIPIRIKESSNPVPIRIKINYIDELEQEGKREFRYFLPVASPLSALTRISNSLGLTPSEATVFISYNHADGEVAEKLKIALEASGIDVRIDRETIEAGENISDFIDRSVRDTNVTLAVISNRSLLSAWVAMETVNTFYHEKFKNDKKFIACYIDSDFFHTDFRINATKQIDARIAEIDQKLPEYIELNIDTIDLNNEKSRLHKLRSNLGDFLLRLRESLTLDIGEDKFDDSVAKIIQTIKKSA